MVSNLEKLTLPVSRIQRSKFGVESPRTPPCMARIYILIGVAEKLEYGIGSEIPPYGSIDKAD